MSLQQQLEITAVGNPTSFDTFARHLPLEWIERALAATGTATVRRRRLPAEQVVWLLIGMALMRDRAIEEVLTKLDLALPMPHGRSVAPSCIPDARKRLGEESMALLFAETASWWAHSHAGVNEWRGLALYGIDGSKLNVADTDDNRATFGGQSSAKTASDSAYPMVRIVALQSLRTHLLAAVAIGPYKGSSELSLTDGLLAHIPDVSLTLMDRNFLNDRILLPLTTLGSERHILMRAKKNTVMHFVERLGANDAIVELNHGAAALKADPNLPKTWRVRAISYHLPGGKPEILLTTLLDPKAYPADELIELYHERWEIELGFDEKKTKMLQRREALRSKSPAAVRQELWGLLLAYNLVRLEMAAVAKEAGVPATRISFIASLHLIRDEWLWCTVAKPGAIPRHLRNLRADLRRFILPARRRERRYPRELKSTKARFPRKKQTRKAAQAATGEG